jgi:hypothetical protein
VMIAPLLIRTKLTVDSVTSNQRVTPP